MLNKTQIIDFVKEKGQNPKAALALAGVLGLASFAYSRFFLKRKALSSAIEASTLAFGAYGAMRKAAPALAASNK